MVLDMRRLKQGEQRRQVRVEVGQMVDPDEVLVVVEALPEA